MRQIALSLLLVFAYALHGFNQVDANERMRPWMGGPCEYEDYDGIAQIISISPVSGSESSKEKYEVRFLFTPNREIKQSYAQSAARDISLLLDGIYLPTKQFIEKNGIEVGKMFPCILHVIVKGGGCAPVMFKFNMTE